MAENSIFYIEGIMKNSSFRTNGGAQASRSEWLSVANTKSDGILAVRNIRQLGRFASVPEPPRPFAVVLTVVNSYTAADRRRLFVCGVLVGLQSYWRLLRLGIFL